MSNDITQIPEGKRRRGRPKGSPNKVAKTVKDMILGALDELGGQEWLVKQAKLAPKNFITLVARVLPTQLTGGEEDSAPIRISVKLVNPKSAPAYSDPTPLPDPMLSEEDSDKDDEDPSVAM